jgi:hypothetical protein
MHVEVDLLDDVCDVGEGECRILESPNEAPKVSWISNRRPEVSEDLGLCVHQHRNQLAINHASMLKNIKSKLALSEEELIRLMFYGDVQKVMEESEVLHGELLLEGRYGLLQKCYTGCGKDNVINVYNKYTVSVPHQKTNKDMLNLSPINPKEVMYLVNQLYHAQGTYFSLYKDLLRSQKWWG